MGIFKRSSDDALKRQSRTIRPMTLKEQELWNKLNKMPRHDKDKTSREPAPAPDAMNVGDCAGGGTILSPPEEEE
jgi:hypothetical protein